MSSIGGVGGGSAAAPGAVVGMTGVGVVRGQNHLLRGVDWAVEADHRWVVLGPNGAGKTTLMQLAAAQLHPTKGEVRLLGETLGAVDVFELRPRIGLTSAALAQRIQSAETTGDIVVSAGYAVVGRWRERYDVHDLTRAAMLMQQWGVAPMAHRTFGTLSEMLGADTFQHVDGLLVVDVFILLPPPTHDGVSGGDDEIAHHFFLGHALGER